MVGGAEVFQGTDDTSMTVVGGKGGGGLNFTFGKHHSST